MLFLESKIKHQSAVLDLGYICMTNVYPRTILHNNFIDDWDMGEKIKFKMAAAAILNFIKKWDFVAA